MAFYRVVLEGKGIAFRFGDGATAIGFFTTRAVKANSAEEAVAKTKALVSELWTSPEYAQNNSGSAPMLTVEEVVEISAWAAFRTPNKGHAFYAT